MKADVSWFRFENGVVLFWRWRLFS